MSYTIKCDDGDLIMDVTGRYRAAFGREKCAQDIAESLLNNYDEEYTMYYNGSTLYKIDQHPNLISTIGAEEFIQTSVGEAVTRLMDAQDNDDYVDETEKIDHVDHLIVNQIGLMSYTFDLRVITESTEPVVVDDFTISLAQQLPSALSQGFGVFLPAGQDSGSKPYA